METSQNRAHGRIRCAVFFAFGGDKLIIVDIAATSIEQAQARYAALNRPGYAADFFAFDCFGVCYPFFFVLE